MIKLTAINKAKYLFFKISAEIREAAGFILLAFLTFILSLILHINLVIPLFLISLALYFKYLYRNLSRTTYKLLNLTFLFVIIFVSSYIINRQGWLIFYLPFASISMLSSILFNELTISLIVTLAASVAVASVNGNQPFLGILFLISGIVSIILVFGARRRNTIIRAGLVVGLVQAIALFFILHFDLKNSEHYLILILNGFACGIISVGVLPVFEYLFKTITNITLLELSDFNQPLLHRLMQEAPGTYHHSLIVGNLSEAACEAIGANALLARIGSYYHDIGKLQKPEYFSENQQIQENRHDILTPTMSKLVIMNHVKEGIELAKGFRLNPAIINFIQQHHGNSLVYYFYRRALENQDEQEEVAEEGFRYPGPKPNTKETAVVLLADSVEAAARALKEPSPAKIEELVHKLINNKFIDGQLDECDLTLKDLEQIAKVFIRILTCIYHVRVTYPEGSNEDNHKKSPKENSHQSEEDNKSSP